MHKRMLCPVLPLIMCSSSSKKLSLTINDAGSRVGTSEKARRPTADEIVEAEIRLYEKRNNTSIPNESIDTDSVSPVNNTPIPDEPVAKASDSVSHVKDTPILDETVAVEPGVGASPVVDTPVTDEPIIKITEANTSYESQPSQSYDDCCNGPNYESEGDCT